jgi:hypothetical protein
MPQWRNVLAEDARVCLIRFLLRTAVTNWGNSVGTVHRTDYLLRRSALLAGSERLESVSVYAIEPFSANGTPSGNMSSLPTI